MKEEKLNELMKKFSAVDFNSEKYVKEVSQVCVGGMELQKHKAKIQALAEEMSQVLKKNVYKNYMQFIETAREISQLEGEMYQLSHLLSEQRALLGSMGSSPPPLEVAEERGSEEKRLGTLSAIAERVQSCISLHDAPGRDLLHEGDLVELDPLENSALHRCHAFLFTDILMITTWISDRRGPAKFKYECDYELGTLAVVNVRDLGNVKYAFKLLVFPDTRLFQCANHQSKEEWLRKLDEAKKARLSAEQGKKSKQDNQSDQKNVPMSPIRTDSIDSGSNPFGYFEDSDVNEFQIPEWLSDAADDIDVCIVERHFEDAYSLIQRAQEFIEKAQQPEILADIKSKIEARTNSLIQVLLNELTVSTDKSLQGGLRATRRSIRLLNQLGKSGQACELYLNVCSNVLKAQGKRVKREGSTVAYVKRLSEVFFSNLASITSEFQYRAFPNSPSCISAFVVWMSMEVSHFMSHFIKQVFMPQTSLNALAESVDILRKQSLQMRELGMDVSYQLNGHLLTPVNKALLETKDKLFDAVKLRCSEDTWRPSYQNRAALVKLEQEMSSMGLPSVHQYVTDGGWLELTSNTLSFVKLYYSLLEDSLTLAWSDLEHTIGKILFDVFDIHLKHVVTSLSNNKLVSQKPLVQKNAKFLVDVFLGMCKTRYSKKMGHQSLSLQRLSNMYSALARDSSTKISITGYI
ncbi:hypothetical protein O3M35_001731 [Rhynocoris fuscipes]|uniref:Exocyst complex component 8 n=1 Tax=Rhynocoris fuscipes TaxID=488301 RepID=A0AAW1CSA1_9HEMI